MSKGSGSIRKPEKRPERVEVGAKASKPPKQAQPNPQQQAINNALASLSNAKTPADFHSAVNTINGIYGAGGGGPLVQAMIDHQRQAISTSLANQLANTTNNQQFAKIAQDFLSLYGVSDPSLLPTNVVDILADQSRKITKMQQTQMTQAITSAANVSAITSAVQSAKGTLSPKQIQQAISNNPAVVSAVGKLNNARSITGINNAYNAIVSMYGGANNVPDNIKQQFQNKFQKAQQAAQAKAQAQSQNQFNYSARTMGSVAPGVSLGNIDSFADAFASVPKSAYDDTQGKTLQGVLARLAGYDGTPKVSQHIGVSSQKAAGVSAQNLMYLYRGTGDPSHVKQFATGDMFNGKGIFGDGSYFFQEFDPAFSYAKDAGASSAFHKGPVKTQSNSQADRSVIRAVIDTSKMKSTTFRDIRQEYLKDRGNFNILSTAAYNALTPKQKNIYNLKKALFTGKDDKRLVGAYATMKGYDMIVGGNVGGSKNAIVILNRTKIQVQDPSSVNYKY